MDGDGFGVGWYGSRVTPGVYRSIQPAWNDRNLRDLAAQIASPLFLAHVRAATETAVQQSNSHPFRYGKWLLVHNGVIDNFQQIKRELVLAIAPELYPAIEGTTDSEIMFYLALTFGLTNEIVNPLLSRRGNYPLSIVHYQFLNESLVQAVV
ncbi:MAG: class II glutamine amidotransferase [Symploca sp. SIO1A3]|nr:class II glutamine amidotransferase [Symploca sp. SIO1A3]